MTTQVSMGAVIDQNGGMGTATAAAAVARIYIKHNGVEIEQAALEGGRWADVQPGVLNDIIALLREGS